MSSENIGLLCSRSRSQWQFKISITICLDDSFWIAEPFVSKLGMLGFLLQEGWCHTDQALCYRRVGVTLIRLCVTGGLVSHWSGFVLQEGWCHTDQALCYRRVGVTLIMLCVTGGLVSHWSGFVLQEGWCHTDQALCYRRVGVTLIMLCVTGGLVSHWSGFVLQEGWCHTDQALCYRRVGVTLVRLCVTLACHIFKKKKKVKQGKWKWWTDFKSEKRQFCKC